MMEKAKKTAWMILLLLFAAGNLPAQHTSGPGRLYDPLLNEILFPGNSKVPWEGLFSSFDSLVLKGNKSIHFLQIGDSHIQAGFLPDQLNIEMSDLLARGCGGRGFIFPYRVAKTNNPVNYSVKFTGNWDKCRNVELTKSCELGLAGIMVSTTDTLADLHLLLKPEPVPYDFNRLRIYHDTSTAYKIGFPAHEGHYTQSNPAPGITEFLFDSYIDSLWIRLAKKDTLPGKFTLFGMEVMNSDPGIIFSAVGVNGAEFPSFLRCGLFEEQLKQLRPQCIIISLGTNDAYTLHFDNTLFEQNARQLIRNIKRSLPGAAILITTPGDSYRKRKYDNKFLGIVREILIKIAADEDCAFWDFYSVMGGPASMLNWYKAGLTAKDKIHFSKAGYYLEGDLLFQAILEAWSNHLDKRMK